MPATDRSPSTIINNRSKLPPYKFKNFPTNQTLALFLPSAPHLLHIFFAFRILQHGLIALFFRHQRLVLALIALLVACFLLGLNLRLLGLAPIDLGLCIGLRFRDRGLEARVLGMLLVVEGAGFGLEVFAAEVGDDGTEDGVDGGLVAAVAVPDREQIGVVAGDEGEAADVVA